MDLPAIDNTVGAWLIGTFIGLILQGVGYNQVYHYCCLYPHDSRWLKTWVLLVTVVETANSVVAMHACYYNLVVNYGNTAISTDAPPWSIKLLPAPAGLVAGLTQLFFARRIYKLNKRFRPIAIIAGTLVAAFSGCMIAVTALIWNAPDARTTLQYSWLVSTGCGLILAGDTLLTTSLIYILRCHRGGFIRTDSMLDVICMYTVSSGLIVCISNAMSVAFAVTWPENLIYAGNVMVATKLYSNTFLASLNARQSLANRGVTMVDAETMQFRSHIMKITSQPDRSLGLRRAGVPFTEHVHGSSVTQSDCTAIEMKVMPHDLSASDTVDIPDFARANSGEKDFIHIS
ncbi:hypothetical protein K466DRAFT_596008 [Polyporus arcularius HHB13444]|uniref:DUF6534 domain-containing protein n=1 Tax=Polyporus arcularius HHB13444 TaxID=1314778 RepID=A0A5C3PQY7_9APHY|nr:hypothetical protein K466DRAFT_596008 [Polyporus arcularius HHB13444]